MVYKVEKFLGCETIAKGVELIGIYAIITLIFSATGIISIWAGLMTIPCVVPFFIMMRKDTPKNREYFYLGACIFLGLHWVYDAVKYNNTYGDQAIVDECNR